MAMVIAILLTLAVAVVVGIWGDRGYVLINFADHTFETSFVVFVFLVAFGIWFTRVSYQFLSVFIASPKRILNWRQERRLAKEKDLLMAGFSRLAEGRWEDAEKLLARYAPKSKFKALAYLGAAWSAEKLGHKQMRDKYLGSARDNSDSNNIATELTQIQFDIDQQKFHKAFDELSKLDKKHLSHPQVLRLTLQVAAEINQWDAVEQAIIPALKRESINQNEAEQYRLKTAYGRLKAGAKTGQLADLEKSWSKLTHHLRTNPDIVNHYAQLLAYHGHPQKAFPLLMKQLNNELHDDCLMTLASLKIESPEKTLASVEKWLAKRPHDDVLLLAAGLIAQQANIWGKAKTLLESSVRHRETSRNHRALAELLEHLNDHESAVVHYRKSMDMMQSRLLAGV